ncbi:lipopolysaccharide assembly protein LapA domain-containing protein [Pararhodobacter sp.]|jgi:uncharacterized membrane protein|uniref:lipopolysaccharide assembly protein LapA domain-containing protein n=1 Tax=Pararhodobacter sp. TaxID=2127056 RepID=UPI002FDCE4AC
MTYLRYAFLAIIVAIAVTVALANRAPVTLSLWPESVASVVGASYTLTLPLFLVVGAAVGLGLVLGLVWEWLRERGQRVEAARARRELERLRMAQGVPQDAPAVQPRRDEVLAILEEPATR